MYFQFEINKKFYLTEGRYCFRQFNKEIQNKINSKLSEYKKITWNELENNFDCHIIELSQFYKTHSCITTIKQLKKIIFIEEIIKSIKNVPFFQIYTVHELDIRQIKMSFCPFSKHSRLIFFRIKDICYPIGFDKHHLIYLKNNYNKLVVSSKKTK